jgi:hypothetical protein
MAVVVGGVDYRVLHCSDTCDIVADGLAQPAALVAAGSRSVAFTVNDNGSTLGRLRVASYSTAAAGGPASAVLASLGGRVCGSLFSEDERALAWYECDSGGSRLRLALAGTRDGWATDAGGWTGTVAASSQGAGFLGAGPNRPAGVLVVSQPNTVSGYDLFAVDLLAQNATPLLQVTGVESAFNLLDGIGTATPAAWLFSRKGAGVWAQRSLTALSADGYLDLGAGVQEVVASGDGRQLLYRTGVQTRYGGYDSLHGGRGQLRQAALGDATRRPIALLGEATAGYRWLVGESKVGVRTASPRPYSFQDGIYRLSFDVPQPLQ